MTKLYLNSKYILGIIKTECINLLRNKIVSLIFYKFNLVNLVNNYFNNLDFMF